MSNFENLPPPEEEPKQKIETEKELSPEEVVQEISKDNEGVINQIRKFINSRVQESKLPTKEGLGYESTIGIYGGKLVKDEEGKVIYDTRGLWSKIDKWGDRLLRSFDENQTKRPGAMFLRHPGAFLKLLPFLVDSKRYRGTPAQTIANAKRLGLDNYYNPHPWGMEIKDPELYSHAIGLQDIFRQDEIGHPILADIDRFEALGAATDYVRKLHKTAGGIGEANVYAFLFTQKEGAKVEKPIITISSLTEIYNPEKHISELEQKATDLLDLFASAATEEYRRSKDWNNIRKTFRIILDHYQDKKVIATVMSYVKRGRLTLAGDVAGLDFETSRTFKATRQILAAHNTQRLSVKNPEITPQIRREIIEACQDYLGPSISEEQDRSQ